MLRRRAYTLSCFTRYHGSEQPETQQGLEMSCRLPIQNSLLPFSLQLYRFSHLWDVEGCPRFPVLRARDGKSNTPATCKERAKMKTGSRVGAEDHGSERRCVHQHHWFPKAGSHEGTRPEPHRPHSPKTWPSVGSWETERWAPETVALMCSDGSYSRPKY